MMAFLEKYSEHIHFIDIPDHLKTHVDIIKICAQKDAKFSFCDVPQEFFDTHAVSPEKIAESFTLTNYPQQCSDILMQYIRYYPSVAEPEKLSTIWKACRINDTLKDTHIAHIISEHFYVPYPQSQVVVKEGDIVQN